MSLVQPLPEGPLDIVGDIHGEFDALVSLLGHLGYDRDGNHPAGRRVVFLGDFVDRGPDSIAVLELARRWIGAGRALAVLGNHEVNLLREDAKDGSGWFFDERLDRDLRKYTFARRPQPHERTWIIEFLSGLPVALERDDLRVVHAVWNDTLVDRARTVPACHVRAQYDAWEEIALREAAAGDLRRRLDEESGLWTHDLEDPQRQPPFLPALAELEYSKQMTNPLKVMTSGAEAIIDPGVAQPFYSGGKWRFVRRLGWWDEYADDVPVIVGHYWRTVRRRTVPPEGSFNQDLFSELSPNEWHGLRGNVFCVDFSVGAKWKERSDGVTTGTNARLAALRWPERTLMFDDGHAQATEGFLVACEPRG